MALLTLRPICNGFNSGILSRGVSNFCLKSLVTHSQGASSSLWNGRNEGPSERRLSGHINGKRFLSGGERYRNQSVLLLLPVRTMTSKSPTSMSSISNPNKKEKVEQTSTSTDGADKKQAEPMEAGSSTVNKDELSTKEKLKLAVRDYGATVIVFHVTMSLASLGFFYVLVSSGLDVVGILEKVGIAGSIAASKVTEEASKFVVAYAIHKVFAPLRITITLGVTPLIVRKLRSMGILKVKPAAKKTNG